MSLPANTHDFSQEQLIRWEEAEVLREADRQRYKAMALAEPADLLTDYGADDDLSGAVAKMIATESMDDMLQVIHILKQKAEHQAGLLIRPVENYYDQTGPMEMDDE